MLPLRVTLPKARPPVESAAEIRASGLLRCVKPNSRKAFYTDGAKAWNTVARALTMTCYQCSHQKKTFAIDMKRKPRGLSKKKGTQTIDRAWLSLKRFQRKPTKRKAKECLQMSANFSKRGSSNGHGVLNSCV